MHPYRCHSYPSGPPARFPSCRKNEDAPHFYRACLNAIHAILREPCSWMFRALVHTAPLTMHAHKAYIKIPSKTFTKRCNFLATRTNWIQLLYTLEGCACLRPLILIQNSWRSRRQVIWRLGGVANHRDLINGQLVALCHVLGTAGGSLAWPQIIVYSKFGKHLYKTTVPQIACTM